MALSIATMASRSCSLMGTSRARSLSTALKLFFRERDLVPDVHGRGERGVDALPGGEPRRGELRDGNGGGMHRGSCERNFCAQHFGVDLEPVSAAHPPVA